MPGVLFLLVLITSAAGFALLAASQRRHRATLSAAIPLIAIPSARQRWLGALLLCASVGFAIAPDGVAFGLVVWSLTIPLTAFAVAALLTLLARPSRPDAPHRDA